MILWLAGFGRSRIMMNSYNINYQRQIYRNADKIVGEEKLNRGALTFEGGRFQNSAVRLFVSSGVMSVEEKCGRES